VQQKGESRAKEWRSVSKSNSKVFI
jgi:hypothetical protein